MNRLSNLFKPAAPAKPKRVPVHKPVKVEYKFHPVDIPADFLTPLSDPSNVKFEVIDFANSELPEFTGLYAAVLDHVLTPKECAQFIRLAEMSAGAHRGPDEPAVEKNSWQTAMVNVGGGYEVIVPDYRNSDRIIWDEPELMGRLWKRIMQVDGLNEYLSKLHGPKYEQVLGYGRGDELEPAWYPTSQGLNERMRFLKYGAGQFFKRHCDSTYITPDGEQESFFTMHLYLNDSAQALGIPEPEDGSGMDLSNKPADLLRGGATTFHSPRKDDKRIDVDPKAGRILIFQHRKLLHSGDDVKAGIKYTLRSEIMYTKTPTPGVG